MNITTKSDSKGWKTREQYNNMQLNIKESLQTFMVRLVKSTSNSSNPQSKRMRCHRIEKTKLNTQLLLMIQMLANRLQHARWEEQDFNLQSRISLQWSSFFTMSRKLLTNQRSQTSQRQPWNINCLLRSSKTWVILHQWTLIIQDFQVKIHSIGMFHWYQSQRLSKILRFPQWVRVAHHLILPGSSQIIEKGLLHQTMATSFPPRIFKKNEKMTK